MAAGFLPIRVEGMKTLRAEMKTIGPAAVREFRKDLAGAADVVVRAARPEAPVGLRPKPPGVPHLCDTLGTKVIGDKVVVVGKSPYANVIHWGGSVPNRRSASTRPKRHFIGRPFIASVAEKKSAALEQSLGEALEKYISRRLGA